MYQQVFSVGKVFRSAKEKRAKRVAIDIAEEEEDQIEEAFEEDSVSYEM